MNETTEPHNCWTCGRSLEGERPDRLYCSPRCQYVARTEDRPTPRSLIAGSPDHACPWCGGPVRVPRRGQVARTCSRACYDGVRRHPEYLDAGPVGGSPGIDETKAWTRLLVFKSRAGVVVRFFRNLAYSLRGRLRPRVAPIEPLRRADRAIEAPSSGLGSPRAQNADHGVPSGVVGQASQLPLGRVERGPGPAAIVSTFRRPRAGKGA